MLQLGSVQGLGQVAYSYRYVFLCLQQWWNNTHNDVVQTNVNLQGMQVVVIRRIVRSLR